MEHQTPLLKLLYWDQGDKPPVYSAARHTVLIEMLDQFVREQQLDLQYFRDRSLLPPNLARGDYSTWPAFDFKEDAAAAPAQWNLKDTGVLYWNSGGYPMNAGWDLGSLKTQALIIVPGVHYPSNGSSRKGIFAGAVAPPAFLPSYNSIPPSAYFGLLDAGTKFAIYKSDNSGPPAAMTKIADDVDPTWSQSFLTSSQGLSYGMALFLDGSAHVQKLFARIGSSSWIQLLSEADASIASFRYLGIFHSLAQATGFDWFNGPPIIFTN